MDRVLELIQQFLQNQWVLIALIALLVISIISLLKKNKNVKNLEGQITDLEVDYNTIKSMPLTFKLNKARSLAKVNELIEKDIVGYVESYEAIQKSIERMDTLFAEANDAIASDDINTVESSIEDISSLITITLKNVTKLNEKLDSVLEQELKLRSEVTLYKERFRVIKEELIKRNVILNFSEDVLDEYMSSAENEFNAFDEWMYVSEFDKATASLTKIDGTLNKLDEVLAELPDLLPIAKEIIPKKIADVSSLYSEVLNVNLYIENLDVTQSLALISEQLSTDLSNLRNGKIQDVKVSLEEANDKLDKLKEKLETELAANEELITLNRSVDESLRLVGEGLSFTEANLDDLLSRYAFPKFKESLDLLMDKYKTVNESHESLVESFKNKVAVSKMLEDINSFNEKLSQLKLDVEKLKSDVDRILSEEKRANQQLLKLYLIINEISVKINDYQIPSISQDYQADVDVAREHIANLEALLEEETLNISLLNSTLSESIDYIYKLYNNVNNIVGMAVMVENAIVFANRYRSSSPQVDSELSKGELYYRNGEYTQALTTVLAVIEELHPNDYEQMIRENSTNVL